jgi:hypothetical protein
LKVFPSVMSNFNWEKTLRKLSGPVIGGIVMTAMSCRSCWSDGGKFALVSVFCISLWMAMWWGTELIICWIDIKLSWTREPLKRLLAGLAAMLTYTAAVVFILIGVFRLLGLNFGNALGTLYWTLGVNTVMTVVMTSRSFLFKWRQAAIDAEKLQIETMQAQYESLKNQVNPHFLFNTLNALTNLVYEDQDKAAKFIKQLSQVYRYVLETRDKEVVPLEEERKFLESYLFLQQIRFGDKLHLDVSLNDVRGMVAPLVLQMLVENAIKHNIISEENPLTISIRADKDFLVVENNLQRKFVLQDESPGIGLENICRRYEFLSDRKVEVIQNDKFIVRLPLLPA